MRFDPGDEDIEAISELEIKKITGTVVEARPVSRDLFEGYNEAILIELSCDSEADMGVLFAPSGLDDGVTLGMDVEIYAFGDKIRYGIVPEIDKFKVLVIPDAPFVARLYKGRSETIGVGRVELVFTGDPMRVNRYDVLMGHVHGVDELGVYDAIQREATIERS